MENYEEKILEYWDKNQIYKKVKEKLKDKPKYYFLDGPPYPTGKIHIGTALNKILKDFWLRVLRFKGYNVWDQPGYDMHGLPTEIKVEQKLGIKNKQEIETKVGVAKFVEECKKHATQFLQAMSEQFKNLGVWMEWERPYMTITNEYIESAWYTFKKGYEKGLLFRGTYPVHVCPHCQTVVAYNEIEHEKLKDPSIYVKFKIKGKDEYLVIWTTTPWTLPDNVAIMAKPSATYVKVKMNNEVLILAEELVESLAKKLKTNYEVLEKFSGKELEGLEYEHPLADKLEHKVNYKVVLSERYVTLEEGTGLVHSAPAHGKEDYSVGLEYNLPVINSLNFDGTFKINWLKGLFAKDADKKIIEELKNKNALLYYETIVHDYPVCWRCKSPLLIQAIEQWFFNIEKIKDKLFEENEKINWVPSWVKARFRNWLESLGNWPISRQRYWGIPLPIWVCENCGHVKVIGSVEELPEVPEDLHKPHIDKVLLDCEKCNGKMKRIPDVLDVWFDSGVAPWASLGYPKKEKPFKDLWPVKLVIEGVDQIRGWWNSLLITSVITFDRRSFENVIFHGFVLDAHGKKMSKSLGNIIAPEDVIAKYSRDTLRLYMLSQAPWKDYYVSWEAIGLVHRKLNVVKNVFEFAKIYANKKVDSKKLEKEDLWILSRLNTIKKKLNASLDKFDSESYVRTLIDFIIEEISHTYIKLIRPRISQGDEASIATLRKVLKEILILLAPITPFVAEKYYLELFKEKESVFLEEFPKVDEDVIDKQLEERVENAIKISSVCLNARQKVGIKLRWPIKQIYVNFGGDVEWSIVKKLCNTKEIITSLPKNYEVFKEEGIEVGVPKELSKEELEEAYINELIRKIQQTRKDHGFVTSEKIKLWIESNKPEIIEKYKEVITQRVGASEIVTGQNLGKIKNFVEVDEFKAEFSFEKV